MPFAGQWPAKGTKPYYDELTAWSDDLVEFVDALELEIEQGGGGGPVAWVDVTGKPAEFPPSAHTHVIADVTDLQAELDARALNTDVAEFVASVGTQVTELDAEIATKATQTSVNALSEAQVTLAGNLDSTFALANGANNAATAAQADADAALTAASTADGKAVAAQTTASAAIPKSDIISGFGDTGVLYGAVIANGGTVPAGLPPYAVVIEASA